MLETALSAARTVSASPALKSGKDSFQGHAAGSLVDGERQKQIFGYGQASQVAAIVVVDSEIVWCRDYSLGPHRDPECAIACGFV